MKSHIFINQDESIKKVIKKFDRNSSEIGICLNKKKEVVGIFTEGDFKKSVYSGIDLNMNVSKMMNKNFQYVNNEKKIKRIKQIFKKNIFQYVLVIKNKKFHSLISRQNILNNKIKSKEMPNKIIIFAGGKGERLKPFTEVMPKALLPINNEPILKKIMNEFKFNGFNNFNIIVNYKSNILKTFFNVYKKEHKLSFVEEKDPLGTAGGLYLLNKIKNTFFISNCDILVKSDYKEILNYHKKNKNILTIVACLKNVRIPYGVCEVNKNSLLKKMREKPEFDYLVNTGFYLAEPLILKHVPKKSFFNMDDLINNLRSKKLKIGVYPVRDNSWLDVGQWHEFRRTMNIIKDKPDQN